MMTREIVLWALLIWAFAALVSALPVSAGGF